MVDFGQGYKSLSLPSKELHRLILDERLIHGGIVVYDYDSDEMFRDGELINNPNPEVKKLEDDWGW